MRQIDRYIKMKDERGKIKGEEGGGRWMKKEKRKMKKGIKIL